MLLFFELAVTKPPPKGSSKYPKPPLPAVNRTKMYLQDVSNHLPAPLRGSKLPWNPDWDDQAAAPRDGDGWKAQIGDFRLTLDAQDYSWCSENPNPGSLTFQLRLIHTLFDRERSSWTYNSLQDALTGAEMAYQMLQDALLLEMQDAVTALKESRAA
jgi:hypothetical protein